ncbi:MAG: protein jag [Oscillospiraceae bacterium]|nr:protein jag [Oscillospiraceae bacterium]MBQ8923134.1 protein jag [Oscillospiraceae bacterium]
MTGIFTAPSLDEAKQKAADAFGVPVSEIGVKVLEEPKRSLLGGLFGKKEEFKIEASYVPAMPAEEPVQQEETSAPEITAEAAEEAPDVIENPAPAEESENAAEEKSDVSPEVMLEKMAIGAAYLESVLSKLAPGVTCEGRLENGISFELKGENAGSLIGRRGDTLDALQYLTSMIANRGDKDYVRVTIDTCGYREKRRKALQELAQRISRNVLKSGRSIALEPMNPYERRIIHSTVTEIEGVSSHSSGEEPNRKVIITNDSAPAYKRDDKNARSFRSGGKFDRERGDRRGRRNDRDRRDRRPSGEGPRKLDLSTSFEKDYKRPKPEDALNAGVYGKIDF